MNSPNDDQGQREEPKTLTLGYGTKDDLWPSTLHAGAQSFLKVADAAVTQLGEPTDGDGLTILFLLAQSIELSLKTYLRACSLTEEQLIALDHRLTAALDAAEKERFPKRSATDRKLLGLLDLSYGTGLLRYRRASEMTMPILRPVRELAGEWLVLTAIGKIESPSIPEAYEGPSLAEMRKGAEGTDLRQFAMRWLEEQRASRAESKPAPKTCAVCDAGGSFPDQPTAAPDNPQLFDVALLSQAIQCAAAADAYTIASKGEDWFVQYLLFGTGVECALKAFGVLHGATEKQHLRVWGHNLVRALAYAEEHHIPLELTSEQRAAIGLLNTWHVSKATTFPLVKGYAIPRPQVIRGVLDQLIRAVFVSIWGPDRYAYDRPRTLGMSIAVETFTD